MIFHRIFRFTYFLIFCIWGLQSCTKDDLIETPADTDSETTENPYGIIRIAEKDLTPDVFKLMLQDDEPATILFNNTQRGFRVNQPLQVSITEQQELFIRFYSPRPVKEVTVWATISGYEEAFQLAKFDVLPKIHAHPPLWQTLRQLKIQRFPIHHRRPRTGCNRRRTIADIERRG